MRRLPNDHRPVTQQRMAGVGLVELMVTLLLGALLTAGVIALFNANRQSFRLQDNLAVAQEAGSFAMDFITDDLRIAGYPGDPRNRVGVVDYELSLNDRAETFTREVNGASVNVTFVDDQLATVFQPDRFSSQIDCTGVAIPANAEYAGNRYWVREVPAQLPARPQPTRELVCQGFAYTSIGATLTGVPRILTRVPLGQPQALVSGVESFQVLYGVDTTFDANPRTNAAGTCTESTELPTQYVTADELLGAFERGRPLADGGAVPECALPLSPVAVLRSIRIGLVMRTDADVDAIVPAGQTYTVLDRTLDSGNFPIIADGHVRRVFTTTIALRNTERVIE